MQNVTVSAARFYWQNGQQQTEDICSVQRALPIYDVRGRENDAYYCLKPLESQIATCTTQYGGETAMVSVVPASWIRTFDNQDLRSFNFHAYIQPAGNPSGYLDIFARTLTSHLENQNIIIEGSKTAGESSPLNEGYWVRVRFIN